MEGITLILTIAVLVEALVEYAKTIYDMFETKEYKTGITQLITIAVSIFISFSFGLNVFAVVGIAVEPALGTVITGIIISRGSNYASDLIGKLTK